MCNARDKPSNVGDSIGVHACLLFAFSSLLLSCVLRTLADGVVSNARARTDRGKDEKRYGAGR